MMVFAGPEHVEVFPFYRWAWRHWETRARLGQAAIPRALVSLVPSPFPWYTLEDPISL